MCGDRVFTEVAKGNEVTRVTSFNLTGGLIGGD